MKSGRAKPTSGSVRKPSCFDSGKTCECRNRSGFRFDPYFDSSFLNFSSRPLNSTILYNNARIYYKTTNTYPLSNQFFNFYIPGLNYVGHIVYLRQRTPMTAWKIEFRIKLKSFLKKIMKQKTSLINLILHCMSEFLHSGISLY